ncbi:DEAD/DEAH box helicase [Schaalia sp. Marseille-Q2122]|uniref:DEAD/DEAH box helicase n=1 Tax=Schaalia sp. Marseille-Q2122 TaxID=2736604 RepID=UPI0020CA7952|nr:DEAD/DEAH box helicase [Schaalia sp. Marseille-Q2122]
MSADTHQFSSPLFLEPEDIDMLNVEVEFVGEDHSDIAVEDAAEIVGEVDEDVLPSAEEEDETDEADDDDFDEDGDDFDEDNDADDHTDEDDEDLDDDTEDDDAEEDDASASSSVTFADLGLPTRILDAVTQLGFVTPTPIQAASIPALLEGRDVVGIAQTGTGKTAAFGLPLLADINAGHKYVQALILAPTRELAMQSAQALENFADLSRGVEIVPVYGGSAYGPQINALKKGAQVVVGTPGRVIDLIEKGALDLSQGRMFVLDEADEMLRMGFAEDVETITASVPAERRTALFSATMPPAIEKIAATHLTDPVKIEVTAASSTVDTITQTYAVVPYKHKIGALGRVLATRAADAAIVFVRTRMDVEEISIEMASRGFRAAGISGDVAQTERERLVQRLRNGSLDVLVATDVAARGLDVERIGLVVNFDVPREPEAYVHRIGRTGRAGREGLALTFFTPRESGRLRRIEKLTGTPMIEVQIPTPAAVSEFRSRRILEGLAARVERGRLDLYKNLLSEVVAASQAAHEEAELAALEATENGEEAPAVPAAMSLLDIAAALMANAVGDEGPALRIEKDRRGEGKTRREEKLDENGEFVGAVFEGGRDKGERADRGKGDKGRRPRPSGAFGRRFRVEVGKKDGVKPGAIVGAITGEGGIAGKDLGRIEIFPTFSLVEIAADMDDQTMARIGKAHVQGRPLRIREDQGAPSRGQRDGERENRFQDRDRSFDRPRGERGRDDFGRGERDGRGDRGERPRFERGGRDRDRGFDRGERRERDYGRRDGGRDWASHDGRDRFRGDRQDERYGDRSGRDGWREGGRERGGREFHGRSSQGSHASHSKQAGYGRDSRYGGGSRGGHSDRRFGGSRGEHRPKR